MNKMRFFLFSFGLLAMASCGGKMNVQPPINQFIPMNGNFSFTGTSQSSPPNMIFIGGPLQTDSNGHVSGTLGVSTASACIPSGTNAAFTGMIDSQNLVTLTSSSIVGQVISLNGMARPNGTFAAGTYSVSGGCLAGDHGSLQPQHLLTGAYVGSVLINGNTINAFVSFGPPGPPDTSGAFPLQAAASFTNSGPCGGFTSLATEGGSQNGLTVAFQLGAGADPVLSFSGSTIDGTANTLSGTLGITGGPCDQKQGTISLSRTGP